MFQEEVRRRMSGFITGEEGNQDKGNFIYIYIGYCSPNIIRAIK